MRDLKTFQEKIESYRKNAPTPHTQKDLAAAIPLDKDELSKRLNAHKPPKRNISPISCAQVQAIVRTLARWGAIQTQEQAKDLLDLMECPYFSDSDWKVHPLSLLQSTPVPPIAFQSRAASTDNQRLDSSRNMRRRSERPETYIPLSRNPLFQQRPEEFNRLKSLMFGTRTQQKSSLIGLIGLGGIGKTELAVQIAYRYESRFPAGIFWMPGTGVDPTIWQRHLAELAVNTGYLPADDDISQPENEARRARHIGHYLANHPDALLILDNVEDPSLIFTALPPLAGRELACTILYTSRIKTAPPGGEVFTVEELPKEGALRLLLESNRSSLISGALAGSTDAEAEAARTLCQKVENLPFALIQLRALLARDQQMKLVQLSDALTKHGVLKVATTSSGDAGPLFATFWLSWEKVRTEEARKLFKLASFFPEAEPIPLWLLGLIAGVGESSDSFEPLYKACIELQELSLVEPLTGEQVRLHPLVREFGQSVVEDKNTLLAEVGIRLAAEFIDINKLEQRARDEGYWTFLGRVQEVSIFAQSLSLPQTKSIERIAHWLARESALFGTGELWPAKIPGLFYQQLYNRSLEEGDVLSAPVTPRRWLRQVGRVSAEDRSLFRELKHPDVVTSVAFSSSNRTLITGCNDGAARVWDVPSGKEIVCLKGHEGAVTCVAFSHDDRQMVTGSPDKTVRVWDRDTGLVSQIFRGGNTVSVAFSPDGERVAAASAEGVTWVWDIGTGQVVWKLVEGGDPHDGYSLTDIAFSPDGETLATISAAGWIVLWDVATGSVLDGLEGCRGGKASISFSSDGKLLGSGSGEGAMIWDLKTKKPLVTQIYSVSDIEATGLDSIMKLALLPDELDHLAARATDETVEILFVESIESGGSEETFYGHTDYVKSVCFSQDGLLIATGSADHTARVWSVFRAENYVLPKRVGDGAVQCLAFSQDGTTALAGLRDEDGIGLVQLWDVANDEVLPQTFFDYYGWIESVAFSSDAQKVAIGGSRKIGIWDVKTEQELASPSGSESGPPFYHQHSGLSCLCFSPDNQRIALGFHDGMVRVWDTLSDRIVANLPGHRQGVKHVMFSFDGTKLVAGSIDGSVHIWDGLNYTFSVMLQSHAEDVTSMCVSPDGQWVAIGTRSGIVSVWWLKSTILQKEIKMHTSEVTSMSFSLDGHLLITCSRDGQTCLWAPRQQNPNHPLGIYVTPYPVRAIHWQDMKRITLADLGGLRFRPHFYHLVLDGVWEEELW